MSVSAFLNLPVVGLVATKATCYFEEDGMQIEHSVRQELS